MTIPASVVESIGNMPIVPLERLWCLAARVSGEAGVGEPHRQPKRPHGEGGHRSPRNPMAACLPEERLWNTRPVPTRNATLICI